MYLVRYDYNALSEAEVGKSFERFPRPGDACRIVRIGKDQHPAPLVTYRLKVLKVHFIASVRHFPQWVEYDFVAVFLRYESERMIYRRLDDHLVSLVEQSHDRHSYSLHNARNE